MPGGSCPGPGRTGGAAVPGPPAEGTRRRRPRGAKARPRRDPARRCRGRDVAEPGARGREAPGAGPARPGRGHPRAARWGLAGLRGRCRAPHASARRRKQGLSPGSSRAGAGRPRAEAAAPGWSASEHRSAGSEEGARAGRGSSGQAVPSPAQCPAAVMALLYRHPACLGPADQKSPFCSGQAGLRSELNVLAEYQQAVLKAHFSNFGDPLDF